MHLHELEDGLVYRVIHDRPVDLFVPDDANDTKKPSTKGGTTRVEIGQMIGEGEGRTFAPIVAAIAVCSMKDNYSKKRGRDIALGRALLALRNPAEVERRARRRAEDGS